MKKIFVILTFCIGMCCASNYVAAQTKTTTTTETKTKKGMSKRAKGALIGGAAGAVGGAIIGKNVGGALIGGAAGAGAGYIIGNETDKKKSRAAKKKVTKTTTVTEKKVP
jgi:hypothetical protein